MPPSETSTTVAESYDEVPYRGEVRLETHPDSMATAAALLGVDAPTIDSCRVLELGCGLGTNLFPMAASLPGARFVGIDASPRQIAEARAAAATRGLANVAFEAADILEIDERLGQFDYIICHGVFSWVPAAVQDKILEVCGRSLSPQGVALISYNTYPGWHGWGMVRDMLRYRTRNAADAATRIRQARQFLEFLARSTDGQGAFGRVVGETAAMIRPHFDAYLYHEFLEGVNEPVYFAELVERLAANKLKFLGEPGLPQPAAELGPEIAAGLATLAPRPLEAEQCVDFVANRYFRRSMICHAAVDSSESPQAGNVSRMWVSSLARPASERPDVQSAAPESFHAQDGVSLSTSVPLLKATLAALWTARPATLSFDALFAEIGRLLATGPRSAEAELAERERLADNLLALYQVRAVSLHVTSLDPRSVPS